MKKIILLLLLAVCTISVNAQTQVVTGVNIGTALDYDGSHLYIAELFGNKISRIDLTVGASSYEVVTNISRPEGVAINGNEVYTAGISLGGATAADISGSLPATSNNIAAGGNIRTVVFDATHGLYLIKTDGSSNTKIYSITGITQTFIVDVGVGDIRAATIEGSEMYLSSRGGGAIYKFDLNNVATPTLVKSGLNQPYEIDIVNNHLYFASEGGILGKFDLANTAAAPTIFVNNTLGELAGIEVIGEDVYFTSWGNNAVYKINDPDLAPCFVNIPNANFKAYLVGNAAINTNGDTEIQCSEASAFTGTIIVSNLNISDLTGIEAFTNVTGLRCEDNSLTSLYLYNNPNLTDLRCNNNSLEILNMASGNNTAITFFTSRNNPNLTCIQVDDVSYSITNWTNIDFGVTSFSINCNYPCEAINIPDANFKAALLANTAINTNLDGEISCTEAAAFTGVLDVQNHSILDLTGIASFTNIQGLFCNNNSLTTLDITSNTSLISLRCLNNSLISLNVANGNNVNFVQFNAINNSSLTCITVDDVAYSTTNWTVADGEIDAASSFSTNCTACTVTIPDANFKAYLVGNTAINTNGNTEIECSEASAFTGIINCNSLSISDLTGIEAFTALTTLYCYVNNLTALDLSSNTNLTTLYCNNNNLTVLDLSNNTSLTKIYCDNNSLAALDLSNNTALTSLRSNNNSLTTLNVANGNNTNFTFFDATNNPNLTCIQVDDVAYSTTNWTSIDAASSFSANCGSAQIFDWETANLFVSGTRAVQELSSPYRSVVFTTPNGTPINLSNVGQGTTGLSVRNAASETVVELEFSAGLDIQSIKVFALTNNQDWIFTSFDGSGNVLNTTTATVNTTASVVTLNFINAAKIEITKPGGLAGSFGVDDIVFTPFVPCTVTIPDANFKAYLVGNTAINTNGDTEIQCSEASAFTGIMDAVNLSITDLTGIEAFTSLTTLYCNGNQLTTIDISNNINIISFRCYDNQLSSLDVSNNPNITSLICHTNNLTSLDVSNNTSLKYLWCYSNQITSLNLSNHSNLLQLRAENNALTSLNVANGNNSNFSSSNFKTTNNPNLTCITVDNVAYSTTNWTNIDAIASFSTNCGAVLVSSISVQGTGSVSTITTDGGTLQMEATVLPANADDATYTWSVTNGTGTATIGTNGLLTAITNGTVTVTATANDASGITGTMVVAISNQSPTVLVSSISIQGAGSVSTITTDGGTLQMEVTVLPANADDATYTWSVTNGTGTATIDANGLLTATADGAVTVTATANDASGITGTMVVTISNQIVVLVSSINLQGQAGATTINTDGGTLQMEASVLPANADDATYNWSVTNGTGTATIDANGLLTATADGTVTVTATANDGSGITGTMVVTISNQDPIVLVTSINVQGYGSATTITTLGGTLQMEAAVLPANADDATYTWSVTDGTGTATIDANGLLTATADGTVTVTATANDASGIMGTMVVTISGQCIVNIPDAKFKAYLVGNLAINTNGDAEIQCSEASAFTGTINCNSLSISDLTGIEAFTALTTLYCYLNDLTVLDLSNNTSLTTLYCNNNNLTVLDFSSNTSLTKIYCDNNSLAALDLSNNTVLTSLRCNNNSFTTLNVANGNNANFTFFDASTNPSLTCIQVDDVAYSTTNWTSIDAQTSFSTNCNAVLVNSINLQGVGGATTITTQGGTLQMEATVLPANADDATYTWSVTNGTGTATIDANGLLTATADGTVTVTATANDASGVTGGMVVTISNQNPIVLITSINVQGESGVSAITAQGGTLQMEATVLPANADDATYTWSVNNASASIDANGLLTALTDGTVTVTATANDGSGVTGSIAISISSLTLGINEVNIQHVSIYPNPVNNKLFIEVENEQIFEIVIIAYSGRIVKTITNSNTKSIDVSELKKGVYILKVSTKSGVTTNQFTKQ